jgi:hypothetical protein
MASTLAVFTLEEDRSSRCLAACSAMLGAGAHGGVGEEGEGVMPWGVRAWVRNASDDAHAASTSKERGNTMAGWKTAADKHQWGEHSNPPSSQVLEVGQAAKKLQDQVVPTSAAPKPLRHHLQRSLGERNPHNGPTLRVLLHHGSW